MPETTQSRTPEPVPPTEQETGWRLGNGARHSTENAQQRRDTTTVVFDVLHFVSVRI